VSGAIKSFDRVVDCYDATRAMPPEAAARVTDGLAAAVRAVAPAPRVLEVGIGTGRIAIPLRRAGVDVVGIDVGRAMLARLHAQEPSVPAAVALAAALPFRAATFDAALFVHVLHLLPDAMAALEAARAVLRPGGVIVRGHTRYDDSPRRTIHRRGKEIVAELLGRAPDTQTPHEIAAASFDATARALGVTPEVTELARWREATTAREALDALSRRLYSDTWDIPDAIMPELLARLTPEAEALGGSLDALLVSGVAFEMAVLRLPA
jgi:ubiquinone/menaquinone biosynthesis C-methylase UbiE